jgi:hypothetical protein
MNNSLPRLIDGMIATLRKEVIPRVEGEYARGQAFGVIYMLSSIKLRCSWSDAFLIEQLKALADASRELDALALELPGAPLPNVHAPAALSDAGALEAMRNAGDASLCELIDWLAANRARHRRRLSHPSSEIRNLHQRQADVRRNVRRRRKDMSGLFPC